MRPNDMCPECGCGVDNERDPKYSTWGGWDGYCGHLDCAACKWLRSEKQKINKYYEKLRSVGNEDR